MPWGQTEFQFKLELGLTPNRSDPESLATCKDLGIDPQAYLRDVLDRISTHPARRIEELLPDRWQELRQAGDAGTD